MNIETEKKSPRAGTEKISLRIKGRNGLIRFMNIRGNDIIRIQEHDTSPFCTVITKDCSLETVSLYDDITRQLSPETQKRLGFTEIIKRVKRHK